MCHVRERIISINKFKSIVEVEMRVVTFSLKLVTLAKLVTSFNAWNSDFRVKDIDCLVLRYQWYILIWPLDQAEILFEISRFIDLS
jgi:hypothetical protein